MDSFLFVFLLELWQTTSYLKKKTSQTIRVMGDLEVLMFKNEAFGLLVDYSITCLTTDK